MDATEPIPRVEDVTPPWLTSVLRRSGALERASVVAIERELIGLFSSELWRLRPAYDAVEPGAPTSIVLKQLKPGGTTDQGQRLGHEIRFYRELGSRLDVRTARFHYGASGPRDALLIMEDVPGLVPISFWEGATEEHTALALEQLARLHASWWGCTAELDWIPSFADAGYREDYGRAYDRNWKAKREFFADVAPYYVETGDALSGRVGPSLAGLGEPTTLLHGDAHLENLVLIEARDGARRVFFHDWAGVQRGAASFDVAVFSVMSFKPEDRRRLEQGLVARHAEVLHAELGRTALADPWTLYRRGVLAWAVCMAEFVKTRPATDLEKASRHMVLHRCATAAVDLDVAELIE